MKLLDKYISKRFWQFFLFAIFTFVIIFLVVDIVENLDYYIDHKAKGTDVLTYYFYYIPYIIVLVTPIGTLLAAAFLGGFLVKNHELVAIRSSGISSRKIAMLLLMWGFAISIVVFFAGELVIPRTNSMRDEIKRVLIAKQSDTSGRMRNDLFYICTNGMVIYFRTFDIQRKVAKDVILHRYENGMLTERIDAKTMRWQESRWIAQNAIKRTFAGMNEKVELFTQLDLNITELPDDFARKNPSPEEMGFWELRRFIQKAIGSGVIPSREQTDLWMKLAYPLVNLIVLMLGIPLSFKIRKGSYIYGFGQSFFVAFIYLGILRAGQTFGYNATLSPALAAFAGDLIFFSIGAILLMRMEKV